MSEEEFDDGVKAAEEFYKALCKYMGLSTEKSTDNVIRAAFGSVEFACVVALQAGITEVDFKSNPFIAKSDSGLIFESKTIIISLFLLNNTVLLDRLYFLGSIFIILNKIQC